MGLKGRMKKAIITGIYGQDGSFLCEILVRRGYQVYGISKSVLSVNSLKIKQELENEGISHFADNVELYDFISVRDYIKEIQPDIIFHMAAYHVSSEGKGNGKNIREQEIFNKNVQATANILEVCYLYSKHTKVITAGSCLMYDASKTEYQTEKTLYESKSLYGLAKITENNLVQYYRAKGIFACTAILYNHESHRRASQFVTKKIVENMVKIKKRQIDFFTLGALDIEKDWGYAGDYAYAMYLMSQSALPKDYIVSTGETHTVCEFVEKCAQILGVANWENFVRVDKNVINREIRNRLVGKPVLIKKELQWEPQYLFVDLVEEMVDYEINQMCN